MGGANSFYKAKLAPNIYRENYWNSAFGCCIFSLDCRKTPFLGNVRIGVKGLGDSDELCGLEFSEKLSLPMLMARNGREILVNKIFYLKTIV